MSMVVGVDTHKQTHSAALLNELGVVQSGLEVAAFSPGLPTVAQLGALQEY